MAYAFDNRPVATIKAKVTGTSDSISVQGTNPSTTPDNAKAQIDKVLALTGTKTVDVVGMTQTRTAEVIDNG